MPAKLLSNHSDLPRRVNDALENTFHSLARPAVARRLRLGLVALFAIWGTLALSQLIWALLPQEEEALPAGAVVINPANVSAPAASAAPVDIERLRSWHLFGEASAMTEEDAVAQPEPTAPGNALDGIEKGARETRLALKLRGVVASTEDGLGYAIIEHKTQQEMYAVEDKLPLPGRVVLAKVMPRQVVLDNAGTYELLELFEDSDSMSQLMQPPAPTPKRQVRRPADARPDGSASRLARTYRERLYDNPQSLADVVTVSAVRENGQLLGYRIAPGKEREQFEQLGFKPGDLVTSVNGIALNDPANTLRLYQTMRSASEAVFDLKRNDQPMSISVDLNDAQADQ